MIIDVHTHARGELDVPAMLGAMDASGIDLTVVFSEPPTVEGQPSTPMKQSVDLLADAVAQAPDRLVPFIWLEPTLPDAMDALEYAIGDKGFKGVKMIPNHWYPTDEVLFPFYERIGEMGVPIIFHSGILHSNRDGSRFCRPVYFEALINFPKVRFALAHIGWPWVDECLAVAGRFRAFERRTGQKSQIWIDTCPGTPPIWRPDALQKTLAYLGDERILWGSDASTGALEAAGRILRADRDLLKRQLGGNAVTESRWMGENALRFLGLE